MMAAYYGPTPFSVSVPSGQPRLLLHIACNDPDNGVFAHCAEQLEISTWDREPIEFSARSRAPRFHDGGGYIRLCRRNWEILGSTKWLGNWCWNGYWLAPDVALKLLGAVKQSGLFECDCGLTVLYDNWNNGEVPFDRMLWAANLWGRHSIGIAA